MKTMFEGNGWTADVNMFWTTINMGEKSVAFNFNSNSPSPADVRIFLTKNLNYEGSFIVSSLDKMWEEVHHAIQK